MHSGLSHTLHLYLLHAAVLAGDLDANFTNDLECGVRAPEVHAGPVHHAKGQRDHHVCREVTSTSLVPVYSGPCWSIPRVAFAREAKYQAAEVSTSVTSNSLALLLSEALPFLHWGMAASLA